VYDELSVSFENPATDPLGYNHVEGKLYCGRDAVELQFKVKDRAFRKSEPRRVPFEYSEVERVEYVSRWFRPKILVFQTRSPEKLADFPGASVGRAELMVLPASRRDASKVAELIRFRQSEAFVTESDERLQRLREEGT
jgi:hypothetical protein